MARTRPSARDYLESISWHVDHWNGPWRCITTFPARWAWERSFTVIENGKPVEHIVFGPGSILR